MLDSVTEVIAHFIGEFNTLVEEARPREVHGAFWYDEPRQQAIPAVEIHPASPSSPLNLADFTPNLRPLPFFDDGVPLQLAGPAGAILPIPQIHPPTYDYAGSAPAPTAILPIPEPFTVVDLPTPDAPGNMLLYANQHSTLSDNDYVGVGGSGLEFHPPSQADAQLVSLAYSAEQLSPLSGLQQPDSPAAIGTFVDDARQALGDFAASHAGNPDIAIFSGNTLLGAYVNGQPVDQAPSLSDHMPAQPATTTDMLASSSGSQSSFVPGEGLLPISSSVHLDMGSNLVVNETHISNIALGAAVMAVGGNDVELDSIVQVNALADHDQISSYLQNWAHDGGPSQTFNVAQFDRIDTSANTSASSDHSTVFPQYWAVTQIHGDLVFMNWVQQFAFVNDHDVTIAAASGVQTSVIAGENQSINAVSLSDLGNYYDLVVVGHNVYTANMISQINVLVDNDLVGTVSGFHTNGQGAISTNGNLQWNTATIQDIGSADRFQSMPDAYHATLGNMNGGDMSLDHGVLGDSAFAGLGALRVLYVSGSIYNVNYIEQHTIVGDNDQVALAMSAVASDPTANWNIVTGSNTLANIASISNLDSMGKTYVGGAHYSDAMLVQSGLVPSASDMQIDTHDPNAIVNEAVAFLTDTTAHHPGDQSASATDHLISPDHPAQADAMHAMLS